MTSRNYTNPFRGLRPFEANERHLFFGRAGEIETLEEKLEAHHFIGVIGISGSGKSSLVRAGLVPELMDLGDWRIAIMRPGDNPIENLAAALNSRADESPDRVTYWNKGEQAPNGGSFTLPTLRQGTLGLIDVVREFRLTEKTLIVVDQFEEIFRFEERRSESVKIEARNFVRLIIEAAKQRELPIYVCITMRSDFLGQCPSFPGLPEALNESQYLVPRLTRSGIRDAIRNPARLAGVDIAPRLVTKLLNEVIDGQDQLPLLQHTLMKTFDNFASDPKRPGSIDITHFEGMHEALSGHLESIYHSLTSEQQRISTVMFKALTMIGVSGRAIRRPCSVREILKVSHAQPEDLTRVIDVFRSEHNCFLMPPSNEAIDLDTLLDLSHESLIRVWPRIHDWIDEERESAKTYLRLVEDGEEYESGKKGLMRHPELGLVKKWRSDAVPDQEWANRYHPGLDNAIDYLEDSINRYQWSRIFRVALPALVVSALALGVFLDQRNEIERLRLAEELITNELVQEFGPALDEVSDIEQRELMRFLAAFTENPKEPDARFMEYLRTVLLAKSARNRASTMGTELASEYLRVLENRIGRHASDPRFKDSDLESYVFESIGTIETLYPRDPIAQFPGVYAAFGKGSIITLTNADELLVFSDGARDSQQASDAIFQVRPDEPGGVPVDDPVAAQPVREAVVDVEVSDDLNTLLTIGDGGSITVWDISRLPAAAPAIHTRLNLHTSLEENRDVLIVDDDTALDRVRGTAVEVIKKRNLLQASDQVEPAIAVATNIGITLVWDSSLQFVTVLQDRSAMSDDFANETILSIDSSPTGRTLVTASEDRIARLYQFDDLSQNEIEPSYRVEHTQRIYDATISAEGYVVTTSYDRSIKVWNDIGEEVATLASPSELDVHRDYVFDVEYSPGDKFIATAGRDKLVNIWAADQINESGNVREARQSIFRATNAASGANRILFHPDFESGDRRLLVSTNQEATNYIWHLDQFDSLDNDQLDTTEPGLDTRLRAGLVLPSDIDASTIGAEDLGVIVRAVHQDRNRAVRILNQAYKDYLANEFEKMLALFVQRFEGASWDQRWILRTFVSNMERDFRGLGYADLWERFAMGMQGDLSSLIARLPDNARGLAYQTIVEFQGDDTASARLMKSLVIATHGGYDMPAAAAAREAYRFDANPVTEFLATTTAETTEAARTSAVPSGAQVAAALTWEERRSLGALTLKDWPDNPSVPELIDAADYFYGQSYSPQMRGIYADDYVAVLEKLAAVSNSSGVVTDYCAVAERRSEIEGANEYLQKMRDSTTCRMNRRDEIRGVSGELREEAIEILVSMSSDDPEKIPVLLASFVAAFAAENAMRQAIRTQGQPTYGLNTVKAMNWANAAFFLSDNAITRNVLSKVINREAPPPLRALPLLNNVKAVLFTRDGKALVGGSDNSLHVFPPTGNGHALRGHTGAIYTIMPMPSGEIATLGLDNTLITWNLSTGAGSATRSIQIDPRSNPSASPPSIGTIIGERFVIGGVPVSIVEPDGNTVLDLPYRYAVAAGDARLIVAKDPAALLLLDISGDEPEVLKTVPDAHSRHLTLSAGPSLIASSDERGTTKIWNRDLDLQLELPSLGRAVRAVTFRDDETSFFVGTYDGMIYEFDLDGNQLLAFRGDSERVYGIDIHPSDPDILLAGGNDTNAKIWSIRAIKEFQAGLLDESEDDLSLDDLARQRALTSKHFRGDSRRRLGSAETVASYLTWAYNDHADDDLISRALRNDAAKAFDAFVAQYEVNEELVDAFEAARSN